MSVPGSEFNAFTVQGARLWSTQTYLHCRVSYGSNTLALQHEGTCADRSYGCPLRSYFLQDLNASEDLALRTVDCLGFEAATYSCALCTISVQAQPQP